MLPAGPIQARQNLGAVQMRGLDLGGSTGQSTAPVGVPTSASQPLSEQAQALLNLLHAQAAAAQQNVAQGGQVQPNQPPVMALHELYQFLMSQGRRVYFSRKQ